MGDTLQSAREKRTIFDTTQANFMRLPGSCVNGNSLPDRATPFPLRHSKKNDVSHFIPGVSQQEAELLFLALHSNINSNIIAVGLHAAAIIASRRGELKAGPHGS